MFTGIITDVGRIEAVEARGDLRVRIGCGFDMATVDLGASIACSGVCLTVVDKGTGWFAVDVSAETKRRTAPMMWQEGKRLNLERSLRVGDELGGHIVTGHVDDVVEVVGVEPAGASTALTVASHFQLAPYIAPKGSIALDGVSLTVNEVWDEPNGDGIRFGINLIPHTAAQTSFAGIEPGRWLNVEVDIIARYLGRMMEARASRM
ncbi:MAG TPA: riboflavin synthase [Allosphingosinicella sp.]|nr:riboflavin synthase [Allosphingosinicella sp.]